ncbi:MAG: ArsR/SmtB family transcription factor [Thermonemataceae bacterium]
MRLKHFSLPVGINIFKCFSDTSRARIIHLLYQNQQMCTSDLELVLDFTQTKTSRHLIYLKNAGLLQTKKLDQWTFYEIKEEVSDIVQRLLQYLGKDVTLQKDQEVYRILHSNRELAVCKIDARKWQKFTHATDNLL